MAIKQKPIFECDNCGNEMESPCVTMEDVPNEGASVIKMGAHAFTVGGQHYCNLECAIEDIRGVLNGSFTQRKP